MTFICFKVAWVKCSQSKLDVYNSSIWNGSSEKLEELVLELVASIKRV
jgi:hypothetical protein